MTTIVKCPGCGQHIEPPPVPHGYRRLFGCPACEIGLIVGPRGSIGKLITTLELQERAVAELQRRRSSIAKPADASNQRSD